ncbi:hypothetical protein CDL15_Pgr016082 [Punica granatum]|uniref:Uncharacterized protein n=1 Tax=Punica granatum TaxID=22663 RepID=A0A218X0M0_PUNGR|nr:hypothetical protein CDL15_Pgr016082 [Punica granatum]
METSSRCFVRLNSAVAVVPRRHFSFRSTGSSRSCVLLRRIPFLAHFSFNFNHKFYPSLILCSSSSLCE